MSYSLSCLRPAVAVGRPVTATKTDAAEAPAPQATSPKGAAQREAEAPESVKRSPFEQRLSRENDGMATWTGSPNAEFSACS